MSKKITREMVKDALKKKWQKYDDLSAKIIVANDDFTYLEKISDNLLPGIEMDSFYSDLEKGDGFNEKYLRSTTSSTMLAVNSFAFWKNRLHNLKIDTGNEIFAGFDHMEFEHKALTANKQPGKRPNLDVWLEKENMVLAIECKFCEFLDGKSSSEFQESYDKTAEECGYSGAWIDARNQLIDGDKKATYQRFDVMQILKHYFGIINSGIEEKHLLYLYWHPMNEDWESMEPFKTHMRELREFADIVSGAKDIQFHHMGFYDLWNQWEDIDKNHVRNLRNMYAVEV